jgi:deoxyribonuclease-4
MLIGAHVSPAGGPANAVRRGEERGCRSIQIFNQNPRAWKARVYSDEELAAYHEAMEGSHVEAMVIHAVYLLNCASEDPEIRDKSLAALIVALNAGAQLKARGVVLHPGSALKNGGSVEDALKRAGAVIKEALAESEECPLLLEDTAGAGGTLGRSFEELATLIELGGGDQRLAVCLDSCHLFASGYDVRTRDSLGRVIDDFDKVVGCDRLLALHVNDSMTELGSNRDRHTNLGDGEIGVEGMIAFLSEPRFEGLPVIFEGPGRSGKEIEPVDMAWAYDLRARGLADQLATAEK